MRLPEPSSSNGGPFAAPVRGRDSLSYAPAPGVSGLGPSGVAPSGSGFFRPSVDFTSIFSGTGGSDRSTPSASEIAPVSPTPSESIAKTSQTEGEDETVQPWDEEEDEAVEENNAVNVQPVALVVAATVTADSPAVGTDAPVVGTSDQVSEPEAILPGAAKKDSAAEAASNAAPADSTDKASLTAKRDASENASQASETSGEPAIVANPVAEAKKKSSESASGSGESESTTLSQDQQTAPFPSQTEAENRGELIRSDATTGTELATQSQNQNALAGNGQSSLPSEGDDASNRTSGRQGRGRTGVTSTQKGRAAQAETAAKSRDAAATKDADSAVNQAGLVDAALSNGPTDVAAIAELGAAELTPAPGEASLFQDQVVTGPVAGGAGSETANRPVTIAGQTSELGAIGTTFSDDSGRGGDRSAARPDENLSRTDIADRARLIHRISKAFTKMGTDGGQIRMKMHPETLGGVLLEMRVRGRTVEATVTADNEAARGLLQQQLSELRQRLESQGMTVQRLEVALRDDSATSGSLLNDHRGEMFGGDRGSSGNGDSRRAFGQGNNAKRGDSSLTQGGGSQSGPSTIARSLSPAAPGTLDLRL